MNQLSGVGDKRVFMSHCNGKYKSYYLRALGYSTAHPLTRSLVNTTVINDTEAVVLFAIKI